MKPALFTIAFVILALTESVLGIVQPRRIATDEDWKAAAAAVRAEFKPGDLIVFKPDWIDQTGRKYLGDLMPREMVGRSDADRYARIWQLSVHEAPPLDEAHGISPALDQRYGRLQLRRYAKDAVKITRDFTADFASARVSTKANDVEHPCLVDGDARRCTSTRVEPRMLEIDYRPRNGVLVPLSSGEITTLAYDDVPGGRLVGYAGMHDYYARKNADGIANLRVRIDGKVALATTVANEDDWKRFDVTVPDGKHQVSFELDSDHPAQRFVGIHAEVRSP